MDTNKELAARISKWLQSGCKEDFYSEFLEQYEYDGGSFEDGMGSYFNEEEFDFMLTDAWKKFFNLYYDALNAKYSYSYDMHYNVTFNKDEEDLENDIIYHTREEYDKIIKNCEEEILKIEEEFETQRQSLSALIIKDIKKYLE